MAGPIKIAVLADASQAKREITGVAKGTETSVGRAKKALVGLAAGFAAFAVVDKVTGALKDSISEARESQKVGRQTAAVLKSTGRAANVSAKQVGNLATSISNKVGIDDEAIQSGENLLLTFKNVRNETGKANDIFNQAAATSVDLAAGLAAANGGSVNLRSSTTLLGKALNDPVKGLTALTRVGVSFTDGQKKQIAALVKSGNTLKAQKIILGELNSEFKGSAAANASSGDKLKVVFKNIEEAIGKGLLPMLDGLENYLVKKLPGWFAAAGKAVDSIKGKVKPVAKAVSDFFTSGAGHDAIVKSFAAVKDATKKIADQLHSAKKNADEFFGAFKSADANQIGVLLGTAVTKGLQTVVSLSGQIGSALGKMFDKVDWGELGRSAGKQIPLFLVGLATGLLNFDPFPILKFMAAHWFEVLIAALTIIFAPAKFAKPLFTILDKIPFVGRFLVIAVKWLNDLGGKVKGIIGDFAEQFWKGFIEHATFPGAGLIRNVLKGLAALPGRVTGFIRGVGETLYLHGLDAFKRLGDAAGKAQSAIIGRIGQLVGKMLAPFKDLAGRLFGVGVDMIRGLVNGIKSMAGAAADAAIGVVKGALDKAKSFLRIKSPSQVFRDEVGLQISLGIAAGIKKGGKKALDAARDTVKQVLQGALSAEKELSSTVAGAFRSDLFGDSGIWGTTGSPISTLKTDIANAKAFQKNLERLEKERLSKAGIRAVAAATDPLAAAQSLGNGQQVAQFNQLLRERQRVTAGVGQKTGEQVFGERVGNLEHLLADIKAEIKKLPKDTGKAVGHSLDGKANKSARQVKRA